MSIKNYSTTIAATKTAGEIMGLLGAKGARQISTVYDSFGNLTGMSFVLVTEYGPQEFALPVRVEGMLAAMKRDREVPRSKCTPEHATKVAWRTAKDWLAAQIALVEAGLATVDEVMMPYALMAGSQTAYEAMRETRMRAIAATPEKGTEK